MGFTDDGSVIKGSVNTLSALFPLPLQQIVFPSPALFLIGSTVFAVCVPRVARPSPDPQKAAALRAAPAAPAVEAEGIRAQSKPLCEKKVIEDDMLMASLQLLLLLSMVLLQLLLLLLLVLVDVAASHT